MGIQIIGEDKNKKDDYKPEDCIFFSIISIFLFLTFILFIVCLDIQLVSNTIHEIYKTWRELE